MALSDLQARKDARVRALMKQGYDEATSRSQAEYEFRIEEQALEREQAQAKPLTEAMRSVGGGAINVARGIPGGEALASALRYAAMRGPFAKPEDRETFAESRQAVVRAGEEYARENPKASATLAGLGGTLALGAPIAKATAAMPAATTALGRTAQAAATGAGVTGAYRALDVRPEEGATTGERLKSRALGTAGQALLGGTIGAVAPVALTSQSPLAVGGRMIAGGLLGGAIAPEGAVQTATGTAIGAALAANPSAVAGMAARRAGPALERAGRTAAQLPGRAGRFLSSELGQMGQTATALGETTGARGVVNEEMQALQDVLTPLRTTVGAPAPGQAAAIARANQLKSEGAALYAKARQDTKILDDPIVQQLMQDPDVAAAYNLARDIRLANGGNIPTVTELRTLLGPQPVIRQELMGTAQSPAPSIREALDNYRTRLGQAAVRKEGTVAQQMAREQMGRRAGEQAAFPITGERTRLIETAPLSQVEVTREVPDPELLHLTKRIMRDVVDRGYTRESTVPLAEALRVEPKLKQLTNTLHSRSSDWAKADRFTQEGHISDEAWQIGWGASTQKGVPSAKKAASSGVEAAWNFIDSFEDPQLRRLAQDYVMQGAREGIAAQAASRGIEKGVAGVLQAPALQVSGPAAQQRELAFGAQAPAIERNLAQARARGAQDFSAPAGASRVERALRYASNVIQNRPEQVRLVGEIPVNPAAYQDVLRQYRAGTRVAGGLRNIMSGVTTLGAQRKIRGLTDINDNLLPGESPIP